MQSATLHERMAGRGRGWAEFGDYRIDSGSTRVNTRRTQGRGYPILRASLMARRCVGRVLFVQQA